MKIKLILNLALLISASAALTFPDGSLAADKSNKYKFSDSQDLIASSEFIQDGSVILKINTDNPSAAPDPIKSLSLIGPDGELFQGIKSEQGTFLFDKLPPAEYDVYTDDFVGPLERKQEKLPDISEQIAELIHHGAIVLPTPGTTPSVK